VTLLHITTQFVTTGFVPCSAESFAEKYALSEAGVSTDLSRQKTGFLKSVNWHTERVTSNAWAQRP